MTEYEHIVSNGPSISSSKRSMMMSCACRVGVIVKE